MTDSDVRRLMRPEIYELRTENVRLIQTHTSWVLLTGWHVYKIKKPVYFGFLDYTTLEARKYFCEEELRLNQRLSPDLYIGVCPVTRDGTDIRIDGTGEVIDYCLKMKELPQDALMTEQLRAGKVTYAVIDELARIIAGFHKRAATSPTISRFGELETVKFNWDENFAQTEEFRGRSLSPARFKAIRAAVEQFMTGNEKLFKARIRRHKIRECHGDLHSRNIFTGEHIRIFDCIEFNQRFSCSDVASEVAFFVMDLEANGEKGLANYFVDRYVQLTDDGQLLKLLDFYKCYRAYVRGKVTSFMLNDPGVGAEEKEGARRTAAGYFRLAAQYAADLARPPTLIIMLGLPGVGKTWLAARLAAKLDCYHLRSDIVRKELMHVPVGEHKYGGTGKGIYAPNVSARTYDELFRRAEIHLKAGQTLILDATFSMAQGQEQAQALAVANDARFLMVNCTCPVKTALARIGKRLDEFSFSDATPEVYYHIRKNFNTPRKSRHLVTVNTARPFGESLKKIETALLRL